MIRITHLLTGEVRISVNGHPHRLPTKGQTLVIVPATKYGTKTEYNYNEETEIKSGDNHQHAS